MQTKKLIVFTGCGHSGTSYIGTLMQQAGLDIGLETVGQDGIVAWQVAGQEDFIPRPSVPKHRYNLYVKKILNEAAIVFHQTRDPIKVFASLVVSYRVKPSSWNYIAKRVPVIKLGETDSEVLKMAVQYWYYWNLKAEQVGNYRYRVEDIDKEFGVLGEKMKRKLDFSALKSVPRNVNSTKKNMGIHKNFTWKEVEQVLSSSFYSEVVELAQKYGYETCKSTL